MNCPFDVADGKSKGLGRVRHMAARDRRENAATGERQI
jgi:hypothetical protein